MMKRLSRRTFIAAGLGASAAAMARWETRPDTILYNGRILTMSTREPEVEALAVAGSRVFATGKSSEMLALAASGARRFDLGGQRVTPGFNDAHSHPGDGGVSLVTRVALEMDSIEAIKAAIAAKAATTAPGEWVVGFLYDDTKTPRPLERADLDAAAPYHPVLVQHRGGHTAFVNSRALPPRWRRTPRTLRMGSTFVTRPGATTAAWRRMPPRQSPRSPSSPRRETTTARVRR
jgi:hypothetical protein